MSEVRWVTLLETRPGEVAVLRGLLEEAGITSFVPDEMTKIVDPFITGPNPFQQRLQVPEADLERARAVVAAGRAERVGQPGAADEPTPDPPADDADPDPEPDEEMSPARDPVEDRAFLTVVLAALLLTLPLAPIAGVAYLSACRRHGRRSRRHRWVLLAMAAPFLVGAVIALCVAYPPPEPRRPYDRTPPPFSTPIGPR